MAEDLTFNRSLATPWTVACQAPLSTGFPRQEYWSGLPFPSPGDPPNPGLEPKAPALKADSLLLSHQGFPNRFLASLYAHCNILACWMAYPSTPWQLPIAMTTAGKADARIEKESCTGFWVQATAFSRISHEYSSHPFQFPPFYLESESVSHSVLSNSLWPHDCSPPGSSLHRVLQARILSFPSPRDLPDSGLKPGPPALQSDSTVWASGETPLPWPSCIFDVSAWICLRNCFVN